MADVDIEHLKRLCKIACTKEEEREIADSLKKVLKYVEQLNEIDTEKTPVCRYVLRGMLRNPMREDVVKDVLPKEKFLANAPDQIGGMVRVPPVLKPSA